MEKSAITTPGYWMWQTGITKNSIQFNLMAAESCDLLVWAEDVDPADDDRGYGNHVEAHQSVTDFLREGPLQYAPLEIAERMLAHFQAEKPVWLAPCRLQEAVITGNIALVEEMLRQGVPADKPVGGTTPFYRAVHAANLALAERLFAAGVDVNRQFPDSQETILMTLAKCAPDASWEPLARRIVAQGAELEAQNKNLETPLIIAAAAGVRLPGLVGILLAAGASVHARSGWGCTPLRVAACKRSLPTGILKQLIAAGSDLEARGKEGWTILMAALFSNALENARCLIAAGADVRAISTPSTAYPDPWSVLQFARYNTDPQIIQQIEAAIR